MTVKPLSLIAVAIQIVFAPIGVQAQHIGILLRVCTKTKLPTIAAEAAFRCPPAIGGQCAAVLQCTAIVLIKAEGIDNLVKLCLEVLRFQICTEVKKGTEKTFAVAVHIRAEVSDQSRLHGNLLALCIAVIPLCRGHCPYCHIHQRSCSFPFFCFSACWSTKR